MNGVRQLLCRGFARLGCGMAVFGLGVALSGCGLSIPMSGVVEDTTPTGSIKLKSPSPFSSEMDGEDWRRAKSALDTALDPQGNGASVSWSNPQSGAKGSFTPLAQPFPKDDGICRVFKALLATKGDGGKSMRSSACRRNGGEWIIGDIRTEAAGASKAPGDQGSNLAERGKTSHLKGQ